MKKYICVAPLMLDLVDDDGNFTEETHVVNPGEVFEMDAGQYRDVGGPDTVRLTQGTNWVEITPDTLADCFEEVEEDES